MIQRRNQHWIETMGGGVVDVVGYVQHRTHRQIDLIGANPRQTVETGHVMQLQLHLGVLLAKGLHQGRQ